MKLHIYWKCSTLVGLTVSPISTDIGSEISFWKFSGWKRNFLRRDGTVWHSQEYKDWHVKKSQALLAEIQLSDMISNIVNQMLTGERDWVPDDC